MEFIKKHAENTELPQILESEVSIDPDSYEPTDNQGYCYDFCGNILGQHICAYNSIYTQISDEAALCHEAIKQISS